MKLQAPSDYWSLSDEEKRKLLNQCGPDGPLSKLVPDHLLGLDISDSCNIHDYMYITAQNRDEQKVADMVFKKNMITQLEKAPYSNNIWRRIMAQIYYRAVRLYSSFRTFKTT
jgi:hypothetical protein